MSALVRLRSYQTKAIAAIHEKWDAGVTRPAVVLPTGAGKGHPLDTEVPTPDGMRLWGHLKVGDMVFGADGKPTEVTAIFDRGLLPTYEVKIWDESIGRMISVEVDAEHLWKVRSAGRGRAYEILETQEIRRRGLMNRQGRPRWVLPWGALTWHERHEQRYIVEINRVGDQPIRCITVAAEDSLYLITRDFIVTHNTVVFTHLAERFLRANPGKRVLILAHTDELVLQARNKMHEVAPDRLVGIVKAAQNEVHAEIVVASVQSLRSKARRDKIKAVGLIVVDECHHASARTYMAILEHYGAIFPEVDGIDTRVRSNVPVLAVGFTATLVRGDDKKLSDVWQDVAFRLSIAFMIRAGYLLDVKGKRVEVPELDLKKVHTSGGDYKEGELADALVEAMAPQIVAKKYLEHASDRKGIGFAPTVDSAYIFSDAFRDLGITSEVVHGKLEKQERRDILLRLKSGQTQVCWSVMALTEGFDEPTVSCAIMARPTKSSGLWQQMVGRVLRPDLSLPPDERGHALLLDVTGVGRLHGLQSLVDLSAREDLPEDVDEDLSLLELEDLILDEAESEPGAAEPTLYYMGPAETVEFDPLGRDSDRSWGRTPDGHFYLAAGTNGYIFLTESLKGEPGSYDLVWCDATSARMTEHTEAHFEMGIAWGEEMAIELGGFGSKTLTAKKAKWRNDPATKGQAYKVRQVPGWGGAKIRTVREDPLDQFSEVKEYRIGTPDGEILTKGKASEIIDGHAAAQRIDPLVRAVKASLS